MSGCTLERRGPRDFDPGMLLATYVLSLRLVIVILLIYLAWCEWTRGDPHCLYPGVITSWAKVHSVERVSPQINTKMKVLEIVLFR